MHSLLREEGVDQLQSGLRLLALAKRLLRPQLRVYVVFQIGNSMFDAARAVVAYGCILSGGD